MATASEFSQFLFRLAKAIPRFAPDLNDRDLFTIWYAEFGKLTTAELSTAFQTAVRKFSTFPSIAELMATIGKAEQSEQDKAREVAERILGAMSKFGQTNGSGESARKKAQQIDDYIGPIGVEVVKMAGGWNNVCEMTDNDNLATMKAQWRGLAESIARRGVKSIDTPPDFAALPAEAKALVEGMRL
jgi:hypothetical protein